MTRPSIVAERSVATFLFAVLALSPPVLAIFSVDARPFGIPLLYFFLFAVWGTVIAVVAWIADMGQGDPREEPPGVSGTARADRREDR